MNSLRDWVFQNEKKLSAELKNNLEEKKRHQGRAEYILEAQMGEFYNLLEI